MHRLIFQERRCLHVSGDFCIRKFFYTDTKISASTRSLYESYTTVHTYPIRIQTSQRISQQSMHITKKTEPVTSAYTKIYGYKHPHVSAYTAYTEIATLESLYRNLWIHRAYTYICVDTRFIRIKKLGDTKICRGPIGDFCQNFSWQIFFFTRHGDQNGCSLERC